MGRTFWCIRESVGRGTGTTHIFCFVLKVSPNSSKLRLKNRRSKNRYDNFSQFFYTKAQKSFLKIAKNKKNYVILDSSNNDNNLEKKIFKIVCKYLKIWWIFLLFLNLKKLKIYLDYLILLSFKKCWSAQRWNLDQNI